ncbi:MAG: cell division protein ZapD [Pseudomonadota bacterium]
MPHRPECGDYRFADLSVPQGENHIVFEQPLSERVRTFMRLEFLFQQRRHHALDDSPTGTRAALQSLLDVLSLTARSDLKSEVIKEIQDQQTVLTRAPTLLQGMDARQVFARLADALKNVQRLPSHFAGSSLRSHEFLDSMAKRSVIPGGAAPFDMPALHRWLGEPTIRIRADLERWFAHFAPYEIAISTCLDVLRHSGSDQALLAENGVHLHTPVAAHQLLRVKVSSDSGLYPEISAGRYRYSLRFMRQPDVDSRAQQITANVPFQLQCCLLA